MGLQNRGVREKWDWYSREMGLGLGKQGQRFQDVVPRGLGSRTKDRKDGLKREWNTVKPSVCSLCSVCFQTQRAKAPVYPEGRVLGKSSALCVCSERRAAGQL